MSEPERNAEVDSPSQPPQPSQVSVVGQCRLPPFWRASPDLWFLQVESQFQVHRITSDSAQYHLVVSTLDHDTIGEVSDVIRSPPENERYKYIKTTILARLTDSPDAQLHKLLTSVELGDRRPSQLLRHMRSLAGSRVGDEVLRVKWLDLLPQHTRRMLLLIKGQTLEELAAVADEVHDFGPTVMAASHQPKYCASPDLGPLPALGPDEQLLQELASLRLAVAQLTNITRDALQLPAEHFSRRGRSLPRVRQARSRSSTPAGDPRSGHCWYHARYGPLAAKCKQPCAFNSATSTAGGPKN